MLDALGRLGDHLARDQVVADMHIIGGAVMVTEYDARDSTADIDGFDYTPHGAVERAAARVASEMGLSRSWINQQASAFTPPDAEGRRSSAFDHPNLHVYVLAMKVRAGRPTDAEDIATLCGILGIRSVAEVEEITRTTFPGEPVPSRGLRLAADVLTTQ
jgi:hypothetical protein